MRAADMQSSYSPPPSSQISNPHLIWTPIQPIPLHPFISGVCVFPVLGPLTTSPSSTYARRNVGFSLASEDDSSLDHHHIPVHRFRARGSNVPLTGNVGTVDSTARPRLGSPLLKDTPTGLGNVASS
ncbi:hypothetical protein SARC_14055, partial [Sphaeroforma arctica JP610]